MNASLITQKLDARFTGHTYFKYRIVLQGPRTDRYIKFVELRNWCWDTLGSSYERDILINLAYSDDTFTRKWSWHFEKLEDVALYFAGDEEFTLFKLKWL